MSTSPQSKQKNPNRSSENDTDSNSSSINENNGTVSTVDLYTCAYCPGKTCYHSQDCLDKCRKIEKGSKKDIKEMVGKPMKWQSIQFHMTNTHKCDPLR